MKRHPSLIPFSHQHRQMLMLAQLLKRGAPAYKGLPQDLEGKCRHALALYQKVLKPHFDKEESTLFPRFSEDARLMPLCKGLAGEHRLMSAMFAQLEHGADQLLMDRLGRLLEKHIRTEERELFELAQQFMPGTLNAGLTDWPQVDSACKVPSGADKDAGKP